MQGVIRSISNSALDAMLLHKKIAAILPSQLRVQNTVTKIPDCTAPGAGTEDQYIGSCEQQVAGSEFVAPPTTERDGPAFDETAVTEKIINFASFCITRVVALGESADDEDKAKQSQMDNYDSQKEADEKEMETKRLMEGVVLLFARMRKHMGLRTSELLQALALIDIISIKQFERGKFRLCRKNVYLVLLICVMVSHKKNCDSPLSNQWWARKFSAPLSTLNDSEIIILKLLDFNITVSEELYMRYHNALVVCTWND